MRLVNFFLLILLVTSCTKEVKIDIPGYKEQLVIDGSIETGMPAIVLLSTTKDIYAPTNLEAYLNGFVSGATVILSDGITTDTLVEICTDNLPPGTEQIAAGFFGIPADSLVNLHLCAYISTGIFGEVGKSYSLKVIADSKEYTAETRIPSPVALDTIYWKEENNLPGYGFSKARLTDPNISGNSYKWEVKYISNPSFSKPFNPFFDDRFFNGLSFEFAYENPMTWDNPNVSDKYKGYYAQGDTIVVKFSTLGMKEFQFFDKKYNQIYSAGNPFATPLNIPTNIKGGALGIWVGFSPTFDTIVCQ
jgi:hypothetical protein